MKYTQLLLSGSLLLTTLAATSNQYPPENLSTPSPTTTTATQPSAPAPTAAQKSASKKTAGYLGIGVDLLPASVAAQMPKGVSKGQGIVVTRFSEESPAAEGGLKVSDVILSYEKDKIVHPEQFIQLIRNDKPGRQVTLQILRNGKISTQQITIGTQTIPVQSASTSNKAPTNFTGLAIKKVSKNIYDASIGIPTQNGSVQRISFKGTREEIYKQVMAARNLPPQQRQQLIFALTGGKQGGQQQRRNNGPWNMMPFGNNRNGGGGFFPFGKSNNGSFFPNMFNGR